MREPQCWVKHDGESHASSPVPVMSPFEDLRAKQQIPFGNDRKKNKKQGKLRHHFSSAQFNEMGLRRIL
jgi:hypothetical protein